MFIKNYEEILSLARNEKETNKLSWLLDLAETILQLSQPSEFMEQAIEIEESRLIINKKEIIEINQYSNIYLIALGKASQSMSLWLMNNFPYKFNQIIITSPFKKKAEFQDKKNCHFYRGGHPYLNEMSIKAATRTMDLLKSLKKDDLCIFLISGGGSALFDKPIEGIEISEYLTFLRELLKSGAPIHEINQIRKKISAVKGGKLLKQTDAQVISFIISDVPGNDVKSIASGPTAFDYITWKDFFKVLKKHKLEKKIPESLHLEIQKQKQAEKKEQIAGKINSKKVHNFIIGDIKKVLRSIQEIMNASATTEIIDTELQGESVKIGKKLAKIAKARRKKERKNKKEIGFLYGGETTVTLGEKNIGVGGRNQELALSFALTCTKLEMDNFFMLQIGTDGIDGNSKAAGAIVGPFSVDNKNKMNLALKALKDHNSNGFFKKNGGEIITGYTGTNIMDIGIIILDKA